MIFMRLHTLLRFYMYDRETVEKEFLLLVPKAFLKFSCYLQLVHQDILANFATSLVHLVNSGTDVGASAFQDARMIFATPSKDVS